MAVRKMVRNGMHGILLVRMMQLIRQTIKKCWVMGYPGCGIRDFMQILTTFVRRSPAGADGYWPAPSLTATIGARKFGRFRRYRLFLSSRDQPMDIVMAIIRRR